MKVDINDTLRADGDDAVRARHDRAKKYKSKPNGKDKTSPLDDGGLLGWDVGDDDKVPPPRGWLLGTSFCRGFASSLLGDGGVGKTAVRYAQALALATNRPLTGENVFQRCRVLILSLEDGPDELRRRLMAVRLHHGIDRQELKGWLFADALGSADGKLMTLDEHGRPTVGALAVRLARTIAARKIDLVMLDPFVKAHGVAENDNSGIDAVAQTLTDLCTQFDIAVDMTHHTAKGMSDPGNADRGRGASALKDALRLVNTATVMSPDEAKTLDVGEAERRLFVRIDNGKTNLAPVHEAKWFKLVGVSLGNGTDMYPHGDNIQTVEVWTPPKTWDVSSALLNAALTEIDGGLPNGQRYSDAPKATDRAAWPVIQKHCPDRSEPQAREIIRTWVRNRVLFNEDYDDPVDRKLRKGLRLDPTKRPS